MESKNPLKTLRSKGFRVLQKFFKNYLTLELRFVFVRSSCFYILPLIRTYV